MGQRRVDRERGKATRHERVLRDRPPVEDGEVVGVHRDRSTGLRLERGNAGDVIDVAMRHQDALESQPFRFDLLPYSVQLQARIDDEGGHRVAPPDQIAVFAEEIVWKDRDLELLAQRLGRGHPTPISQEADVSTSGPVSVMSTISSRRTPPQPGMQMPGSLGMTMPARSGV